MLPALILAFHQLAFNYSAEPFDLVFVGSNLHSFFTSKLSTLTIPVDR